MDVFLASLEEILTRRLETEVQEWWQSLPADWRDLLKSHVTELLAPQAVSIAFRSEADPIAEDPPSVAYINREVPRCQARKKSPDGAQCRNYAATGGVFSNVLCHVHEAQQHSGIPFERMDSPLREGLMSNIGRSGGSGFRAEWGEITSEELVNTGGYVACQRVDIGGEILLMVSETIEDVVCEHLYRFDRSYHYVGTLRNGQLFLMDVKT